MNIEKRERERERERIREGGVDLRAPPRVATLMNNNGQR